MKKQTRAPLIAKIVSVFSKVKLYGLIEIVKNLDELNSFVTYLARTPKEKVAICYLKETLKFRIYSKEQKINQDSIGKKIITVPTAKDVWSQSRCQLLTNSESMFCEITITSEEFPFSLDDKTVTYGVQTENELFPKQSFIGMDMLTAIRKFVKLVDQLNERSIKEFGKPKYFIPGFETQKHFHSRGPNQSPAFMREGCRYFYAAASFRDLSDFLVVPGSNYVDSLLMHEHHYVGFEFSKNFHFIVLQTFGSEI